MARMTRQQTKLAQQSIECSQTKQELVDETASKGESKSRGRRAEKKQKPENNELNGTVQIDTKAKPRKSSRLIAKSQVLNVDAQDDDIDTDQPQIHSEPLTYQKQGLRIEDEKSI